MFRFLLRFLLFIIALGLIALAVGPLLVDPTPATGATSAKAVARPESRFVNVPFAGTDGIELHFLEQGGPLPQAQGQVATPATTPVANQQTTSARSAPGTFAFVLLHGFTFNAFTWNQLLDPFAAHARVVAYDQTPYGLSAKRLPGTWSGENPYSKAAARQQLFAFMDRLGIERAILVGNSSGGTLALEAALSEPERIAALILLAPWVHANRPILPDWLAQLPQTRRLTLLLARFLGADSPLLDRSYADPSRTDDERRALTGIHRAMANWDVAWGALLNHSLTDPVEISAHLAQIKQPVLVVAGAMDQVVPVADSEATAAELPNAQFRLLPDCGHVPQEECPAQVADAVSNWLRTLPEGSAD
jgi:pimeloyl-ACP methyl ester carboxylesterase